MQSMHDQHDGAGQLVVQPAVEGVVVPLVGGLALRLQQGLFGLERVVDDDDVRTPPCQHPPTEVATRQPWAVVSNSGIA